MTDNTFGHLFRMTTWGESHGPAIGCVLDGVPPGLSLDESDIQSWLDKRKPGSSRFVTQRKEPDTVEIMSGVFEGKTTGTAISLMIRNQDQRSKDYSTIKDKFPPGHADYTYWEKYGIRDYRGGGRSSARETAMPRCRRRGRAQDPRQQDQDPRRHGADGRDGIDRTAWAGPRSRNPFWCPDAAAAKEWGDLSRQGRKGRLVLSAR